MRNRKIAILGTVGLPGNYGGFETLVENLVRYHHAQGLEDRLLVYCSSHAYSLKQKTYLDAQLIYIPLNANGVQSIFYDMLSLFSAIWNRSHVILLLGVSGAIVLPLIRLISSVRIVTNIDGIEWKRKKWKGVAKLFLRFSEIIGVRFSDIVIADNQAIAEYINNEYGKDCTTIAYGGDHAIKQECVNLDGYDLPAIYSFSVCRIEPENNVHLILDAFSLVPDNVVVFVGNWVNSEYGRNLKEKYSRYNNIYLLDPIYDIGKLATLRSHAKYYLHGHSAGGTNPSLVEAMFFGRPIISYDCNFNRYTTDNKAIYFSSANDLNAILSRPYDESSGNVLKNIAEEKYTWNKIAEQYFSILS